MENKEKKLGYGVAWKFNLRAWGIWWKLCPEAFVSLLLSSVVKAVTPYVTIFLSARIIDELSGARRPDQLLRWVVLTLACTAACALLQGVLTRWSNYAKGCAGQLDDQLYMDKMVALDYADVDRQAVFDLYAQIRQNENWSGWGLPKAISFFEFFVTAVVQILGGVGLSVSLFLSPIPSGSGLAFLNHPLSAAAILGLMLLAAVVSPLCANRANRYWTDHAATVRLANRILSFYPMVGMDRNRAADVRIYKQHENVCEPYLDQNDNFAPDSCISRIARGPMGLLNALSQCVTVVLTALVYAFVCLKAWAGAFGVGYITQYVGAITQLFRGLSALLETMGQIRANGEFLQLNFEYLDLPNRMYQGSLTTEKRSDRKYEVEFRDVSFRYPDTDQWALRHVNIKFRVGSRLAVVGRNGSGKTTFIKLLCRLYDPTEGEILLNGIDIRKYRYDDYMRIFSVVFQDFKLLALPLGENVAGAAEYDRTRAEKCLKDAGFGDRLSAMPNGLDTWLYKDLTEDGVDISGGEAQKIAIARALYKDAPFLILDEPTAALDPIAEAEIYSRLNDIVEDRTAVYISHRLSSCKFCDEIAVFEGGQIVQQGSHDALLAEENGTYSTLWHAQAQYYNE
ncbi:MAG: ABC transporter ATP-binding protein/permease [Pseudoflavonifractor capillosus]|uniref:ABC transporter ATP-binding protein n=1 Tax=Pseudoflavonifractor capillosus TaxID=106588 RepID=UPI0023F92DA7|nr:ABC transporter ATP-binding protein [Pseudoflavonifractor capillosus]MCI5928922.1 ABC transporter ATP-binding protein/permease [Pseudoflavonifractor capillosus]MDY4661686.1 ABC transporter ATP-binding protein [Pseudoflavonifractor capillosus]